MSGNKVKSQASFGRQIMYEGDDCPETSVRYDSGYRLGKDGKSYFHIQGVGEDTTVNVAHIPFVIECLNEILTLDSEIRRKNGDT